MPDLRTTVTELATGLGMLGFDSPGEALQARPPAMVSASPETWGLLDGAHSGGALTKAFEDAWDNGRAFLEADDALRQRLPLRIEWKGSHKAPGNEAVPVDLRVDHTFLVSCKYLSRIVANSSPSLLFDALQRRQVRRGVDWYAEVASNEYQCLYDAVRADLSASDLPEKVSALSTEDKQLLAKSLSGGWSTAAADAYQVLADTVAVESAQRWRNALDGSSAQEAALWRLMRIGDAPYYILGSAAGGPLRLRIATQWDWRRQYRFRQLDVSAQRGGQPRVAWHGVAEDRLSGTEVSVEGHIEIRWSHGRFGGKPEAKVYLDTPHSCVPGYYLLK